MAHLDRCAREVYKAVQEYAHCRTPNELFDLKGYKGCRTPQAVRAQGLYDNRHLLQPLLTHLEHPQPADRHIRAGLQQADDDFKLNWTGDTQDLWARYISRMLRLMIMHLRRIAYSHKRRTQALRSARPEVQEAVLRMIDILPPLPIGDKGRSDAEDDDDDDGDGDVRAERGDGEQGAEPVEEMNGGAVRGRERELKRKISCDDTGFPKMIGDQEMEQPQRKLMKQVSVDSAGYSQMLGSHSPPRTTTVATTTCTTRFRLGSLPASSQEELHKQAMAAKEVPSNARSQKKLANENAPLKKRPRNK
jgi:hypothetical protein